MNLKQLARSVKNYIKMSAKGEAFVELFDVNDNSVVFEVPTIDDIQVGTSASPDGEFLFTDGTKIVIKGGVVTVIEKPIEEEKIEIEEEPVDEVDSVEPIVEESEKDARITELEATNAQLMDEISKLKGDLEEKVNEITDVEKELSEIQNFYVAMNKAHLNERRAEHKNDEGMAFSFKKKSKI